MQTTATLPAAEPYVIVDRDARGVVRLTLNRPRQFNALSEEMLAALQTELDAIAADPQVRVVVIAGQGKAFCAGHDLKQMRANPSQEYYEELFARCSQVMLTIQRMPQPVIARVHGIATAAGCQLVAMCDLAVASEDAQFAVSGINVGLFCSTPAVALSRNVGRKAAFKMLVTGEFIDARTAQRSDWSIMSSPPPISTLRCSAWPMPSSPARRKPLRTASHSSTARLKWASPTPTGWRVRRWRAT